MRWRRRLLSRSPRLTCYSLGHIAIVRSRGHSVEAFLPLPGAHAVGHTFVEVGRADGSLYAREPHLFPYFGAYTSEGKGDALAAQLFDLVQRLVAGAGVNEVHRICVQKHML